MTYKFKIGDRVKYNSRHTHYDNRIGTVIEIRTFDKRYTYVVQWDNLHPIRDHFTTNELMKIVPPDEILKEIL